MSSITYNYTGAWQVFTVPAGVTSINVSVNGAAGGGGSQGGRVLGRRTVAAGQRFYLVVGGAGKPNVGKSYGAGGWGSGGHGGAGYNANGGDGGGGYSAIRYASTTGPIIAVAGGGGGHSGDGGAGGEGGTSVGGSGSRGTSGAQATGQATGGSQSQGGNGGTSSSGSEFHGGNASDTALGAAGPGGNTGGWNGPGGGGGGGGYRSGGGGQGGSSGYAPAGGGGGGSNYYGGLTSPLSYRGTRSGNGYITISWTVTAPADHRPSTPTLVAPTSGAHLKAFGVGITATLNDADKNSVKLRVVLSTDPQFTHSTTKESGYVATGKNASVAYTGLVANTRYYARLYAVDTKGAVSATYSTTTFYTDLAPTEPTLTAPADGFQTNGLSTVTFKWTHVDPDDEVQAAAQFRWWADKSTIYTVRTITGPYLQYDEAPGTFRSNTFYYWQVRTRDKAGLWGPWSLPRSFFVSGVSTPPTLIAPLKNLALDAADPVTFSWRFIDPDPGDSQSRADLRWRVVGTADADWHYRYGDGTTPGADRTWTVQGGTFIPGYSYEWQARTYDTLSGTNTPSQWSESGQFIAIATPGRLARIAVIPSNAFRGTLGVGNNVAYLAVKGGTRLLGKMGTASHVEWSRRRDDISTASVTVEMIGDAAELLSQARTWQHEVVIFRGKRRVWEGPITKITMPAGQAILDAQDVLAWTTRRIMKHGYDDTYPNMQSAVYRASRLIINAFARDDPNVLPYLTLFQFPDDAQEARSRPDWSSQTWDELDDLASNAGIDYTVVGRRIIVWDTHRPIGKLPLLRSQNFTDPPIISEYGMSLATEYGVTNGSGIYGSASKADNVYGPVELLSSSYSDVSAASDGTMTREATMKVQETLNAQAQRNIADRYPAPLIVRVPDNSSLQPTTPLTIDELVPGVWVPLQAEHDIRTVRQWQKLDGITVTQDGTGAETVQVVLSAAPNSGEDPDAGISAGASDGN